MEGTKDEGLSGTTAETVCGTMYDTTMRTMRRVVPQVGASFAAKSE